MILIVLNLLIIFLGTFLYGVAINVILSPVLLNDAVQYGIDPLHFAIMFSINACIGLLTPPLGANLFVVAQIYQTLFDQIVRNIFIYANWVRVDYLYPSFERLASEPYVI